MIAGLVGGAIWGGIAGWLKAQHRRARGHLDDHAQLHRPLPALLPALRAGLPGAEASNQAISIPIDATARFPRLLRVRAVGQREPDRRAARGAGLLVAAHALDARLPAARRRRQPVRRAHGRDERRGQLRHRHADRRGALRARRVARRSLGGNNVAITGDVDASIGFDAITVALLGRASPGGTVLAGILFGALRAGAVRMQAETGVADRDRAGHPVGDRAVHRRARADPGDLPVAPVGRRRRRPGLAKGWNG